ncbi:MAG TPA: hypothetical protein VGD71_19375 [Kribbella sp.]|jgi:predicted RNA binding protein YcfA (HicA-like mRNA interferase family)
MPTEPADLDGLPEPAHLHACFSEHHRLDWGTPIQTTALIAAEYGPDATAKSLKLLCRLVDRHGDPTRQFLHSIRPGEVAHQLESRIKSPASLARKIWKYGRKNRPALTDDVLRFTVLAEGPDTLVDSARGTVDRLNAAGWRVESAHQSYLDDSRYKGLHAIMRTDSGVQVEVQFHTSESIGVKTLTTGLYHTERDPRQTREVRAAASREAIQLSAAMTKPSGIDALTDLGGVEVEPRRYGSGVRHSSPQPAQGPRTEPRQGYSSRSRDLESDGMTR